MGKMKKLKVWLESESTFHYMLGILSGLALARFILSLP